MSLSFNLVLMVIVLSVTEAFTNHSLTESQAYDGLHNLNLNKRQHFRPVQIESICGQNSKCDSEIEICVESVENIGGGGGGGGRERRKCW